MASVNVEIVGLGPDGKTKTWEYQLPAGSTVADALVCLPAELMKIDEARVGIWGKLASFDQALHEGDRIELYQPLKVDPKVARRQRFEQQGKRSTGLFKK